MLLKKVFVTISLTITLSTLSNVYAKDRMDPQSFINLQAFDGQPSAILPKNARIIAYRAASNEFIITHNQEKQPPQLNHSYRHSTSRHLFRQMITTSSIKKYQHKKKLPQLVHQHPHKIIRLAMRQTTL